MVMSVGFLCRAKTSSFCLRDFCASALQFGAHCGLKHLDWEMLTDRFGVGSIAVYLGGEILYAKVAVVDV